MSSVIRTPRIGSPAVLRTSTALRIADGISFNEWQEIGTELSTMTDAIAWWIGDWYAYGLAAYRKDYSAGVDAFGRSMQGLTNLAYVSRKVPPSRRREGLTWGHHYEVAALEPDSQDAYLETALMQKLSARELRTIIREARGATRTALEPAYRSLRSLLGDGVLELAERAAEHRGVDPVEWARRTLEQAARDELDLVELTP